MALEATHIRFALDIKKYFGIKDIKKYILGTIYPDSRYVTGIDKKLTHNDKYIKKIFYKNDDFKKGWAVHLLYDKIQYSIYIKLFDDLLSTADKSGRFSDDWIIRSAIKTLQDINDVHEYPIDNYLESLRHAENPNSENIDDIKKYNNILIGLYSNPQKLTVDSIINMWTQFGVPNKIAEEILKKSKKFEKDSNVMKRVKKVYDLTLKYYKNNA